MLKTMPGGAGGFGAAKWANHKVEDRMTDAQKREVGMRSQTWRSATHYRHALPNSQEKLQQWLSQLENVERQVNKLMGFSDEDGQDTFSPGYKQEFQQKLIPLKEWLHNVACANGGAVG